MRHQFGWCKAGKCINLRMFVRKKKNRSGATSMVVVEKSNGVYHEIRTIGTSKDDSEVESFVRHGKKRIEGESGTRDIFEAFAKENEEKQIGRAHV